MIKKIMANGINEIQFLCDLKKRSGETSKKVEEAVSETIENVRFNGDKAVKEYTLKFDGSLPYYYEVPRDIINEALDEADEKFQCIFFNSLITIKSYIFNDFRYCFLNFFACFTTSFL